MQNLSGRIANISPSGTLAATEKAEKLERQGIEIARFTQGEPDFYTPAHIKEAGKDAINANFTKYTNAIGILELKEAICKKLKQENNLNYRSSEIAVSNGAKQALFNAFMVICEEGDEVIIPSPCYVSYVEQIKLSGATPVLVKTRADHDFVPSIGAIEKKISDKTKVLLINSPCNPTGAVYSQDILEKVAKLAVDKGFYIVTDEVYEHLLYDGAKHISIASLNKNVKKQTVTVNGVSKTYSMTGWRIGYAAGPENIIQAISKFQGHVTGNPNSIAQKASIEALEGKDDFLEEMVSTYDERRKFFVNNLNQIDGFECSTPKGAFYIFPKVTGLYGRKFNNQKIENDIDVVNFLLEEARVASVPGSAFEGQGYIRFTYSVSMDIIKKGLHRIEEAVNKIN